jgi:putative nucleotidyltransferase with HDIG domain
MDETNFFPINLRLLRIDTILGIDLYLKGRQGYVLYRSRTVPFNDRVRANLISHGVENLYIVNDDKEKFARYVENNLVSILGDPAVDVDQKRQLVYDSSINVARGLLQNPTSPDTLKRSNNIVRGMVDLHLKDSGGFKKIIELMPLDYSLINHSANVATYSIAIGKAMGIGKNDLYELGLGALLHDIGKNKIPKEILYKPGKLSSDEFELIKKHVLLGLDMVSNLRIVPRQSLNPILWHHERLSGHGYPYGRSGEDIPLFGMITAIADSFDAMTTNRIYQSALSTFQSLETLLAESECYDMNVVLELVKLMSPQDTIDKARPKADLVIY